MIVCFYINKLNLVKLVEVEKRIICRITLFKSRLNNIWNVRKSYANLNSYN